MPSQIINIEVGIGVQYVQGLYPDAHLDNAIWGGTLSTHTGKHRLSTSFPNAVPTYCGYGSTIKVAYSGNFAGPELFVAKAGLQQS